MEFKNFKINYNWWENYRDLVIQHQDDLQKLDQLFEQFYEQNDATDLLEWSINYWHKDNSFHLWQEYCTNILLISTKQFDRLLNPLLFKKIVKTWTKYYGKICDHNEHYIHYDLDTNKIANYIKYYNEQRIQKQLNWMSPIQYQNALKKCYNEIVLSVPKFCPSVN